MDANILLLCTYAFTSMIINNGKLLNDYKCELTSLKSLQFGKIEDAVIEIVTCQKENGFRIPATGTDLMYVALYANIDLKACIHNALSKGVEKEYLLEFITDMLKAQATDKNQLAFISNEHTKAMQIAMGLHIAEGIKFNNLSLESFVTQIKTLQMDVFESLIGGYDGAFVYKLKDKRIDTLTKVDGNTYLLIEKYQNEFTGEIYFASLRKCGDNELSVIWLKLNSSGEYQVHDNLQSIAVEDQQKESLGKVFDLKRLESEYW